MLQYWTRNINMIDCHMCMSDYGMIRHEPCGHLLCLKCAHSVSISTPMEELLLQECCICGTIVRQTHTWNACSTFPIPQPPIKSKSMIGPPHVSSKINEIIMWIHKNRNKKVVIASQWITTLDLIQNAFHFHGINKSVIKITGSDTFKVRAKRINAFQTDPDVKICLLSLTSSSEGITLTAASTMFIVDLWWNR
jgi:SNF2 family DNA or RNA helicase